MQSPEPSARCLDTRKTTPGLRRLEKLAAGAGGVTNHRFGLFDAVLIKNNHITAAGGVRPALERIRQARLPPETPVEIEIRTREELDEALAAGAWHVLLDNLTPKQAAAEIHTSRSRQSRAIRQHHARHDSRLRGHWRRFRLMRRDHASGPGRQLQLPNRPFLISMPEIHRFASLPSTMHKAAELAQAGCASRHGSHRRRTNVRPRPFRPRWHSEPGSACIVCSPSPEAVCRQLAAWSPLRWDSRRQRRSRM